jgi:hypothetical protein
MRSATKEVSLSSSSSVSIYTFVLARPFSLCKKEKFDGGQPEQQQQRHYLYFFCTSKSSKVSVPERLQASSKPARSKLST